MARGKRVQVPVKARGQTEPIATVTLPVIVGETAEELFESFASLVQEGVDPVGMMRRVLNAKFRQDALPSNKRSALAKALGTEGEDAARQDLVSYASSFRFGRPREGRGGGPTVKAQSEYGKAVTAFALKHGRFPSVEELAAIAAQFGINLPS